MILYGVEQEIENGPDSDVSSIYCLWWGEQVTYLIVT